MPKNRRHGTASRSRKLRDTASFSAFDRDEVIERDFLWWLHEGNRAIRVGDWKLVAAKDDPWELYDLSTDRAESKNLVEAEPEKALELERLWNQQLQAMNELAGKTPDLSGTKRKRK